MTNNTDRVVTLRHAISGAWCIEAPHPQYGMPQPHFLAGRTSFRTFASAAAWIEQQGCVVVSDRKAKQHIIYSGGRPLVAA